MALHKENVTRQTKNDLAEIFPKDGMQRPKGFSNPTYLRADIYLYQPASKYFRNIQSLQN